MKRPFKRFIFLAFILIIIFLLLGRTKNTEITFQNAVNSYNQYEYVVNDFIDNPSEAKISTVSQYEREFINNYYSLMDHQTLYNKLFRVEPILKQKEIFHLEDLNSKSQKLDKSYESTALNTVFEASDISDLLGISKIKGKYISDSLKITNSGENYNILIQGTFYANDASNILRRYFIIETEQGNYYWRKPDNFSISFGEGEVSIKIGKTKYDIKANIIY